MTAMELLSGLSVLDTFCAILYIVLIKVRDTEDDFGS